MTRQVEAKRASEEISGIPNVAYNVLTVLQNKLKGIAAIEAYKMDCRDDRECQSLFEQIQQHDTEDIAKLRDLLARRLSEGIR